MMGVTPEEAARELRDAGADVVGANCGNGIEKMLELARLIRDATDGPMLMHSNAGIPDIRQGQIVYPETPEFHGAAVQGKCTPWESTSSAAAAAPPPRHIRAISEILR